ncbi:MAG: chemotaxis protein CheA [Myxococcaceae bacterium]|nr:chemotaxis protein CheA [Myxococcaceae bacterium]
MTIEADDIAVFLEEASELLTDFEQCMLLLETLPDDADVLNRAFRCAHTIKGGAGMVGLDVLQGFTHTLENLLDQLRETKRVCTRPVIDALLASSDVIRAHLDIVRQGKNEKVPGQDEALALIAAALADGAAASPVAAPPAPAPSAAPAGVEPPAPPPVPVVKAADPRPSAPEPRPSAPDASGRRQEEGSATIRVPVLKVDRLINLVGELVIAQSMVSLEVGQFTAQRLALLQDAVGQLDRHCRDLQEQVLGIRMIPVKAMFDRFHRVVRDLSTQTGKQVVLQLEGEDTELDKTVIEKVTDPLTHLVRNAIDHGLEQPDERTAAGKPAGGALTLRAYQRGSSIFIEVEDDGRGLDRAKIVAKAIAQGLISPSDTLSDDDVHQLIFRPGFSTAERVTELSGRGVGMDVVRRNVEELKGKITIESQPGKGSRFRIQLPLTLAMLEGLSLRVGSEVFLMPLLSVAGSFRPTAGQISTIGERSEVVMVRERYVPLVRLHDLLGQAAGDADPCKGIVVVVDDGDRTVAVLADELIGQQQVVVKSLEANFGRVAGISGATVLGDGRVAFIIDVAALFELGQSGKVMPRSGTVEPAAVQPPESTSFTTPAGSPS